MSLSLSATRRLDDGFPGPIGSPPPTPHSVTPGSALSHPSSPHSTVDAASTVRGNLFLPFSFRSCCLCCSATVLPPPFFRAFSVHTLRLPGSDRLTLSSVSPPLPLSTPPPPLLLSLPRRSYEQILLLLHLPTWSRHLFSAHSLCRAISQSVFLVRRDATPTFPFCCRSPVSFSLPLVPLCSPALAFCLALAVSIISRFSHGRHERSVSVVSVPRFSRRIMYT